MKITRIFLLHHTHVDLGYTDARARVERRLVEMMDAAMDLCRDAAARPDPEQFRWIHEVSWPVLRWLEGNPARREELFDLIRRGRMELTAFYLNPTDLFDREAFEASLDYAVALARRESLPLDTAMFGDCPGLAWSLPDLLAARGIRYLSAAPDFIMSYPLDLERPFYWEGPDGGRVLTWCSDWRHSWYAEGLMALKLHEDPDAACRNLTDYLRQLEDEGYRWSGLAIHAAMDNEGPRPALMDFVARWNAAYPDREVRLATNHDFFAWMEQRHGAEFAVHRGAWPDWWSNGLGAAAREVACTRRAQNALRRAAALAAALNQDASSEYLAARRDALENVLLFAEHTWGDSRSGVDPWRPDVQLAWAEKRAFALRGLLQADALEARLLEQSGTRGDVVLFNPHDAPYDGPFHLASAAKGSAAPALHDLASGEVLHGQRLRSGRTAGPAGDCYRVRVPPRSFRAFARKGRSPATRRSARLETDFLAAEVDERSGRIVRLRDKAACRDLIPADARWGFAEIIHERTASPLGRRAFYDIRRGATSPDAKRPKPPLVRTGGDLRSRVVALTTGPVFTALLTRGRLPFAAFEREIRLYHHAPRLDVVLRLHKQVRIEYESLYLAFPLAFDPAAVWIENAGAVFRAGADQLPGSATDWFAVGDYAAVTDESAAAVLTPHDAPLLQVGDLHTGAWQTRLRVERAHLYAWVMNNLWFTNFPACQEGETTLTWSLLFQNSPFDPLRAAACARMSRVGLAVRDAAAASAAIVW